ncbi:MAG: hypothetical protein L3K03_09075 [Thermoplasmata archaeon]|nr:hypothetical protein [Thermoplasmata archaeon]
MADKVPPRTGPARSREEDVGPFLLQYVQANPGLKFGVILRAAQAARNISRATAARHLSRLVRFGEIVLLPNHTYTVGGAPASTTRAMLETRWYDLTVVVQPSGSTQVLIQEEFRVSFGQLDHLDFGWAKPIRKFSWWCTTPGHVSQVPAKRAPSGIPTRRIEFSSPLTARKPEWQRYCLIAHLPDRHRMSYRPKTGARGVPMARERVWETESIDFSSQDRRFGQRLTPDAHLRLQVAFPEGYPIGPVRSHVRFQTEPDLVDAFEEFRLAALAKVEWHQDGLQTFGSRFILSVPRPLSDRHYEIEWAIPTAAQRDRWLAHR